MPGQKQPIELLKVKGKKHLTKDEIKKREKEELKAYSDKIVVPEYLSNSQKKTFKKLSEELKRVNIMTNLDTDSLARFIIARDLYLFFTQKMFDDDTREDIFELEKVSNMQDKYYKQCANASKDLGLTISSRCKLVIPNTEKKDNPLREALGLNG